MVRRLKILVFAYVYPPDAGSGTYRTLYFANHWAAAGDDVTVITVDTDDFARDALVDQNLCKQIAPSIKVVRASAIRPLERLLAIRAAFRRSQDGNGGGSREAPCDARRERPPGPDEPGDHGRRSAWGRVKDAVTTLLAFPDAHNGWIIDAFRRGVQVARAEKPDCLYASGGPWSTLVVSALVQRATSIPLIIDFRDPWASNPNLARLERWAQRAHRRLEAYCVRRAQRVIANTEELRADFVFRYGDLDAATFVCVTNGFEEVAPGRPQKADRLVLVHAGALYMSRNPGNFLTAVRRLIEDGVIERNRLAIRFVGGIEVRGGEIEAALESLRDVVEVLPRVEHERALAMQREAGGLLLFQAGFPLQVPRKLYEYLSLNLPILAITDKGSATARLLDDVGSAYTTEDDVAEIYRALMKLYKDWEEDRIEPLDRDKLATYSNRHLAGRLRAEMLACAGELRS